MSIENNFLKGEAYVYTDAGFYLDRKLGVYSFHVKIKTESKSFVIEKTSFFKEPKKNPLECEILCVANATYMLLLECKKRKIYLEKVNYITDSKHGLEKVISQKDKSPFFKKNPKLLKAKKLILALSLVNGFNKSIARFIDVKSKSKTKNPATHNEYMNLLLDKRCKNQMSLLIQNENKERNIHFVCNEKI